MSVTYDRVSHLSPAINVSLPDDELRYQDPEALVDTIGHNKAHRVAEDNIEILTCFIARLEAVEERGQRLTSREDARLKLMRFCLPHEIEISAWHEGLGEYQQEVA